MRVSAAVTAINANHLRRCSRIISISFSESMGLTETLFRFVGVLDRQMLPHVLSQRWKVARRGTPFGHVTPDVKAILCAWPGKLPPCVRGSFGDCRRRPTGVLIAVRVVAGSATAALGAVLLALGVLLRIRIDEVMLGLAVVGSLVAALGGVHGSVLLVFWLLGVAMVASRPVAAAGWRELRRLPILKSEKRGTVLLDPENGPSTQALS
jgi:hypothetical protein